MEDDLAPLINEWMLLIEKYHAARGIPISERVWSACNIFAKRAIVSLRSEDGEEVEPDHDFLNQFLYSRSFAQFYELINDWYERRYTNLLNERDPWTILSVISFSNVALEVRIPILLMNRTGINEGIMLFLRDIDVSESSRDWVLKSPTWSHFSCEELKSLDAQISDNARILRSLRVTLMTADTKGRYDNRLRTDIIAHIETAARHLLSSNYGLSVWDSHQACEKTFKLILRQNSNSYKKTHELLDLSSSLRDLSNMIDHEQVASMPSGREVIRARYGEGENYDFRQSFGIYQSSLRLLDQLTKIVSVKHPLPKNPIRIRKPEFLP